MKRYGSSIDFFHRELPDGDFVRYDDAMAEIGRLEFALKQEQNRAERLKAPQKVLQADDVTGPVLYWWRLKPGYSRQIKNIWRRYIPSTNQWVFILSGEFIGPIPYPDPGHADD